MKWYIRYPAAVALLTCYSIAERTAKLLPQSDTVFPSTGGDVASLVQLMFALCAGGVLAYEQSANEGVKP